MSQHFFMCSADFELQHGARAEALSAGETHASIRDFMITLAAENVLEHRFMAELKTLFVEPCASHRLQS
eukprot:6065360-Amphidinium_carterae.3